MADDRPPTPYEQRLGPTLRETARRRREERAVTEASSMPYIEAVNAVGQRAFGVHWIGPRSDEDKRVLTIGEAHPRYDEASSLENKRDDQYWSAERWLKRRGLVVMADGCRYVFRKRLQTTLDDEFPNTPEAHASDGSAAGGEASETGTGEGASASASTTPAPAAEVETDFSASGEAPRPTGDADPYRTDAEADKALVEEIEAVKAAARLMWPDAARRPPPNEMAAKLAMPVHKLGYSKDTIRQILIGT